MANRIIADLQLQLARHFRYPLLARRRGIEGKVVLEIEICQDGRICGQRLLESSGYRILDRAALRAASRIQGMQVRIAPRRSLALKVPVIYRLEGG